MNRKYIIILALLPILLSGCVKDKPTTPAGKKVEVVMNGAVKRAGTTRGDGRIDPVNGLPPKQLIIGVATLNYTTSDAVNNQPDDIAWGDATADWAPAFFGGPDYYYPTNPSYIPEDGVIKYLREDLTGTQIVFYDEGGQYYYVRALYPWTNTRSIQTANGYSIVFENLNGSTDVMCSNLGWGNKDNEVITTSYTDSDPSTPDNVLVMSHMFSLFRVKFVAENAAAAAQFGTLMDGRLANQPSSVRINMVDASLYAVSRNTVPWVNYPAVDFPTGGVPANATTPLPVDGVDTPVAAGYVMAMPATNFTFEIYSSKRLWLTNSYSFAIPDTPGVPDSGDPYATSKAGYVYDVTIKFMESYELVLKIEDVTEWWMDSIFD